MRLPENTLSPATGPSTARVLAAARSGLTSHPPLRHLRSWLWLHTAQPNGQPWDDNPEALEDAARQLAAELAGGA